MAERKKLTIPEGASWGASKIPPELKRSKHVHVDISAADKAVVAAIALSRGIRTTEVLVEAVKVYMSKRGKWKKVLKPKPPADPVTCILNLTADEKAAVDVYAKERQMMKAELFREALADFLAANRLEQ